MKYLVQILFLFFSINLSSQSIFNEDLEWFFTNTYINPVIDDLEITKFSMKIMDEKIVNGNWYKHLYVKYNETDGYQPSDKYMRKYKDTILVYHADQDIEIIEYIESAYIDQVVQVNQTFQSCAGKVIEIDSIESFGKVYKTTKLDWVYRTWIEGIGTNTSMFTAYTCVNQGNILKLDCVFKNGEIIYQRKEDIECGDLSTSNEKIVEINNVKVFPNPTSDILRFNKTISDISIFDGMGKLLIKKTINSNTTSIEDLPKGMYFLKFSDGYKSSQIKKIIKI